MQSVFIQDSVRCVTWKRISLLLVLVLESGICLRILMRQARFGRFMGDVRYWEQGCGRVTGFEGCYRQESVNSPRGTLAAWNFSAVSVFLKKRNWSTPAPDRLVNCW